MEAYSRGAAGSRSFLHRPALGQGGLAAALQARLDAVERRGEMHAELLVEGSEKISRAVQEDLYNIAHEALNNALKHAHAKSQPGSQFTLYRHEPGNPSSFAQDRLPGGQFMPC